MSRRSSGSGRALVEQGEELVLVAVAPGPRVEARSGASSGRLPEPLQADLGEPGQPVELACSVVAPSPVSRYGRRRSSGSSASISPRRSSRASAPYSVPGPSGAPEIRLDVGHDRVAVLRPVGQRDEDVQRRLGEPTEIGQAPGSRHARPVNARVASAYAGISSAVDDRAGDPGAAAAVRWPASVTWSSGWRG